MNYEDVMMLVRAGYTKEEISAMQAPAEPDQPELDLKEPAPPVLDLQEPAPPVLDLQEHDLPVLDLQEHVLPEPAPVGNDQILAALNKLTQAVITNNINRQAFDPVPQRTAEDALAEIIAPPAAHRNKLGGK